MTNSEIEKMVKAFRADAVLRGDSNLSAKSYNKAFDRQTGIFEVLKTSKEGLAAMKQLLEDDNIYVRYTASSKLVDIFEQALTILEEIIKSPDTDPFLIISAKYTLKEYWRKRGIDYPLW